MIMQSFNWAHSWKILLLSIFVPPIVWLLYKFVEERLSPLQKIPCPPGSLPLVGHLFTLLRFGGFLEMMRIWAEQYAPMFILHPGFGIGIGGYRVVVIDPELVKSVTIKNAHKFKRSDFVAKAVPSSSKGLFSANGKVHARQKRMISPAFSVSNLKGFLEVFQENTEKLVELWSGQLEMLKQGRSIDTDVQEDLSHLTLDVIGQSAFGYSFNTILGGKSKVSDAFTLLFQAMSYRYLICKFLIPFFDYLPLAETKKLQSAREIADKTVLKVIHERRIRKRQGCYVPAKKDLLDLLMDMYDEETDSRMDDDELRSQVFTFILAGNETTTVALSWTLYELAKNPHIQERLRKEVQTVISNVKELTWEKLEKLEYLRSVIKESLRLHPPGYVSNRVAKSDVEIGGYRVPGGTVILLPMDAIQRSSHYWSKPEMFDPERFQEKDGQTSVQSFSYIPFGCGPRMCIGNKFALMEMTVILATLVKAFSFHEIPGCVVKEAARGTNHPDGLRLRVSLVE